MSINKETSVLELVINGKQAETSINGLTNSIRTAEREFRKMREADNPRAYAEAAKNINLQKIALNDMRKSVNGATKESEKFGTTWQEIAKGVVGGNAITSLIQQGTAALRNFTREVIQTYTEFEKYSTVLQNSLGSQDSARRAMADLQQFAAQTPFSLSELTESYVKYVNRGIIPTMDQMTKMGDLAASQGKSFDQLTEAILDAGTGEFERLKEFGIRASKNGDKVALSFKGITKEVAYSDEAIQAAILSFGEMEGVVNGMAKQSETLGGKISNLGDAWDQLLVTFGSRTGGVLYASITAISDYLSWITDAFKSTEQLIQENTDKAVGSALSSLNKRSPEEIKQIIEGTKLYIKDLEQGLLPIQNEIAAKTKEINDLDLDGSVYKRNSLSKELDLLKQKEGKQKQLIDVEKGTLQAYDQQEKQKTDVKKKADDEKLRLQKQLDDKEAVAKQKADEKKAEQAKKAREKEIQSLKDTLTKEMRAFEIEGMDPLDQLVSGITDKFDVLIAQAQKLGRTDIVKSLKELKDKSVDRGANKYTTEQAKKDKEAELKAATSMSDAFYQIEKNKLGQQYADGLLSKEDYDKKTEILEYERVTALIEINKQYGVSTAELETQLTDLKISEKDREIAHANKKEQEKNQFAIQMAQLASDTIFDIVKTNQQAEADAKIQSLNAQRDKELSSKELSQAQVKRINDKFDREVAAEKTKAWKNEQKAAAAQALINGALAITNIFATTPKVDFGISTYLLIAASAAATLAAEAKILTAKPPKFKDGGFITDGPSHANGGMKVLDANGNPVAEIEGGEPILSRETYRNNRPTIDALLYSSQRMNGARINLNSTEALSAERYFRSGGIITPPEFKQNVSNNTSFDMSETNALLRNLIEQQAKMKLEFSLKTFHEENTKYLKTQTDASV